MALSLEIPPGKKPLREFAGLQTGEPPADYVYGTCGTLSNGMRMLNLSQEKMPGEHERPPFPFTARKILTDQSEAHYPQAEGDRLKHLACQPRTRVTGST